MKVPITRPFFDDDDRAAVAAPLDTGWVVQGPNVEAFEKRFASYVGAANAVACTSGTTALHLALAALGVGPGDEVVVPSFTWVSTVNAVLYCGARPVLCDVDVDTMNVNVDDMLRRVGPRTRGFIPVHLFGQAADLSSIVKEARNRALFVVEDAACGLDAFLGDTHVGTFGDVGIFSFHPRKAVTTGEGGMLTSNNSSLAEAFRTLRNHGSSAGAAGSASAGEFERIGFNYRMTEMQAALGVSQMKKAHRLAGLRSARAARYHNALDDVDWLRLPRPTAGTTHGFQSFVCRVAHRPPLLQNVDDLRATRDRLMESLAAAGIQTRPGTHAVHQLTYHRQHLGLQDTSYPGATVAAASSIALPLFPSMTEDEQLHVIDAIKAFSP